jgi:hypothetical protein
LIERQLFGVGPTDLATLATVTLLMFGAVLAAAVIPAWRAAPGATDSSRRQREANQRREAERVEGTEAEESQEPDRQ